MTALLAVEKFRYGRSPWRIVYTPTGLELPHARFARKCDAVATLDKLLAAADWTRYPDFTAEDKASVWNVLWDTPGGRLWLQVVRRQMAAGAVG